MVKVINEINGSLLERIDDYIQYLKDICGFDSAETNFAAVKFSLIRIGDLPFEQEIVIPAIERAMVISAEHTPNSITSAFVGIYQRLIEPKSLEQEIEEALKEDIDQIWYQFSTFATHTFPQSETDLTELVTEYPNNKLSIESVKGIPFGGVARIIVLYVNSMAVKYRSREISLGKSIKDFVENLGYQVNYKEGQINDQVFQQLEKLFHTTYVLTQTTKTKTSNEQYTVQTEDFRFHLFDSKVTLEKIQADLSEKSEATVVLSEAYYKEILSHPVPLSLDTIKALKKSPLALDLYAFISYRANANKVIPAKLSELKKQFAITGPNWRFRSDLQRALKYIQKQWPECNVLLKTDVLVIQRMLPHITSQTKQ